MTASIWELIAALTILASAFGGGWFLGHEGLVKYQAQVVQQTKDREVEYQNEKKRQDDITKEKEHETSEIISAQSGYISSFLRKSAASTAKAASQGPPIPYDEAVGQGSSGNKGQAPEEAGCDAATLGTALLGWEEVQLWRQWAREEGLTDLPLGSGVR